MSVYTHLSRVKRSFSISNFSLTDTPGLLIRQKGSSMIKHLVFWKLKDNPHGLSKQACMGVIQERMHALRGKIPGLLALEIGMDCSRNANSSDLCLYSEFESWESLATYQAHPLHQAIVPYVAEIAAERRVVDYEA